MPTSRPDGLVLWGAPRSRWAVIWHGSGHLERFVGSQFFSSRSFEVRFVVCSFLFLVLLLERKNLSVDLIWFLGGFGWIRSGLSRSDTFLFGVVLCDPFIFFALPLCDGLQSFLRYHGRRFSADVS